VCHAHARRAHDRTHARFGFVGVEQLLQGGAFPQGGTWEPANLGKNTRHTSPGLLGKKFQNKNIKTSYLGLIS
jgi:hypothetical protein